MSTGQHISALPQNELCEWIVNFSKGHNFFHAPLLLWSTEVISPLFSVQLGFPPFHSVSSPGWHRREAQRWFCPLYPSAPCRRVGDPYFPWLPYVTALWLIKIGLLYIFCSGSGNIYLTRFVVSYWHGIFKLSNCFPYLSLLTNSSTRLNQMIESNPAI